MMATMRTTPSYGRRSPATWMYKNQTKPTWMNGRRTTTTNPCKPHRHVTRADVEPREPYTTLGGDPESIEVRMRRPRSALEDNERTPRKDGTTVLVRTSNHTNDADTNTSGRMGRDASLSKPNEVGDNVKKDPARSAKKREKTRQGGTGRKRRHADARSNHRNEKMKDVRGRNQTKPTQPERRNIGNGGREEFEPAR
mmetsp:Transcript_3276/g.20417  ORF Transcript_3276/g.20417 Transcript_3276/m.20417 type:complete len:197 (+) Transcript_3276:201-791(+)